ncbi:MAG: TIGR03862 family flavoprotein [Chthoniobacter sp.]|nr:TIGR03862 family flavoprotein [Chthoniobacter sp.]
MLHIAVIGGGPAGLRAAEVAAAGGARVTLFDAKPSVGRKFLVAGRGGLNLTKDEPRALFATRYGDPARWAELLADGDAGAVRAWAAGLGVETFVASTKRVYPRELKAAPLLRRWVARLRAGGVRFALRHRWTGLRPGPPWQLDFAGPDAAPVTAEADAVILALGGGSWPETGSDGAWTTLLERLGVPLAPLHPANCGWTCPWPDAVRALAGQPLKNIAASAGDQRIEGELLITDYGLEGGALYPLAPTLRAMSAPRLAIDFKPTQTAGQLAKKLTGVTRDIFATARQRWRLGEAASAILSTAAEESVADVGALAALVKNCPLALTGPRPLAEAISTAGGVRWEALDAHLMLRQLPGVFVAGEMLDWEAPTGGYLITGCFATGTRAARGALRTTPAGSARAE